MSFVRIKDLDNVFYTTLSDVRNMIKDKYTDKKGNRIFTKKSIVVKIFAFILFTLPIFLGAMVFKVHEVVETEYVIVIAYLLCTFITAFFVLMDFVISNWHSQKKIGRLIKVSIIVIILIGLYLVSIVFILPSSGEFLPAFISVSATYIMGILGLFIHKRTSEMNTLQEKILGFRMFLVNIQEDRINTLVEENPEYFYDILLYAYVMGITDKWAKQFERLSVEAPS